MRISNPRYEAPRLKVVGSVAALTREGQNGDDLDQAFGIGTDVEDLTFS